MKRILFLLFSCSLLLGCADNKNQKKIVDKEASAALLKNVLGSFVGSFGENKIRVLITRAEAGLIEGRSIVGGNDRPFSGTISEKDGAITIQAREPGDDPNDGIFDFRLSAASLNTLEGSWAPFDKGKASKNYSLQRKQFAYKLDAGEYPQASQRELKPEDVENMMKSDLEYMRNEIFARHGYCFKKKELRQSFEMEEWYVPDNTDVRNKLTAVETKNIQLIKRYEKYAEDYGDEFGR